MQTDKTLRQLLTEGQISANADQEILDMTLEEVLSPDGIEAIAEKDPQERTLLGSEIEQTALEDATHGMNADGQRMVT